MRWWRTWEREKFMPSLKYKYLLGVASGALAIPMLSEGALADPQLDAVLQRLDKLQKEKAKLRRDIKDLEERTTKLPMRTASVPSGGKSAAGAGAQNNGFVQVAIPNASYGAG